MQHSWVPSETLVVWSQLGLGEQQEHESDGLGFRFYLVQFFGLRAGYNLVGPQFLHL